jgi:hypothetical protein
MRSAVAIGAGAGLIGGAVGAAILSIVAIKGSSGEMTRAVILAAHAAHSDSPVLGWLVLMAAGLLIGALFGALYWVCGIRRESAAWWATLYALAWWVVGWFAVMPPPLRFAPWAATENPALFQLAVAGLLACLGYGATLAGAFTLFGAVAAERSQAQARTARVSTSNGSLTASRR